MMLNPVRASKFIACLAGAWLAGLASAGFAQTAYYTTNGTEYSVIGSLPGDQVYPDVALNTSGGFVVWQDNATDGSGWGISARRVDSTLSGSMSTFRVNVQGTNDQEHARVALLKNGGAMFVWQGGVAGLNQHIYARFLAPTNTVSGTNYIWLNPAATNDYMVNSFTNNFQANPALCALKGGNVVVVWESFDQSSSNSLRDVYGQILTTNGTKIGAEFLINQFTTYNQRNPAVAALTNGGFVVTWVSEQERSSAPNWGTNSVYYGAGSVPQPSVDIYARLYNSNGVAQTAEFLVNADSNPASNPSVAVASDGTFMVAWNAKDMVTATNSWDIYARSFTNAVGGAVERINTHLYGDQYLPHLSALGTDYLVVWTSLGQDGYREGVYGQFVHEDGSLTGGEFRVNTTTLGQQMQPAVASDGVQQFLAVWTSFTFTTGGMDLFAQRYMNVSAILPAIDAVYVWAPFTLSNGVYQPQLAVSWPTLLGISISNYEIHVDAAVSTTNFAASNLWVMTKANGLTTNATHSFAVDYVTTDGRRSTLSPAVNGTTWSGLNWNGIPYEWMAGYFGGYSGGVYNTNYWPAANTRLAPGGPTLVQVFMSGSNPLVSTTWLQQTLTQTPQGMYLGWNTQPGHVYQVQVTTDFGSWSNVGGQRFAAGLSDSMYVGGKPAGFYRIVFLY